MKRLLLILLLPALACGQSNTGSVVVLANSIDSRMASILYYSLNASGLSVVGTDAAAFETVKSSPLVVILGGHMSPEGVGSVVSALLSESEKASLMLPNASRAFEKDGVWAPGQRVFVFAGYSAQDTRLAWAANLDNLSGALSSGLSADISVQSPESIIINPKSNMKEYMFPVNVTNNGEVEAEFGMDSYLNGGVRLESEPARLKLRSGQTARVLVKLNPRKIADGDTVLVKAASGQATTRLNVTQMENAGPCLLCNRGV